jgi:hypothetical protein
MIRIRTRLSGEGNHVFTIWFNGKWITLATQGGKMVESYNSTSLMEAGQNHLQAAFSIREKIQPAKDWQERAAPDHGFIDDDMGGGGD